MKITVFQVVEEQFGRDITLDYPSAIEAVVRICSADRRHGERYVKALASFPGCDVAAYCGSRAAAVRYASSVYPAHFTIDEHRVSTDGAATSFVRRLEPLLELDQTYQILFAVFCVATDILSIPAARTELLREMQRHILGARRLLGSHEEVVSHVRDVAHRTQGIAIVPDRVENAEMFLDELPTLAATRFDLIVSELGRRQRAIQTPSSGNRNIPA